MTQVGRNAIVGLYSTKANSQGTFIPWLFIFVQFNITTTEKNGLIQECERKCNLGLASISGDAALLVEFTNHINNIGREVWHTIFNAYGGWQYDDGNQTDLPTSTTALVADQAFYALPAEALSVRGIEFKNSGGVWQKLNPLTEEQIRDIQAVTEFYKTSSTPLFYRLVGNSIQMFPPANYALAAALKVSFDRGSVAFASTATTTSPGFASEYHEILASGASYRWARYKKPGEKLTQELGAEYTAWLSRLDNFYGMRFKAMFPKRVTTRDSVRENQ